MAELIGIYTGASLNAPASNLIRIPTVAGTITGVYIDLSDVADGDTEFEVTLDGVLVTAATVADTTEDESVTGLSTAMSLGSVIALNLIGPFPTTLPDPPITLIVTYSADITVPDEAYGVGWNGSLEVPTKNALYDKIETISAGSGTVDTANSPAAGEWAKFTDADTIEGRTASELKADLDLEIGTDLQAYDADLTAIAGLTSAANKIIRYTGAGTADLIDFKDEDDMASDSATAVPSQQSVKAYVDAAVIGGGGYTDEQAQDAVGGIMTDSAEIDFTYSDATPSITASIVAGSIDETKLDASVNASLDLADTAVQPSTSPQLTSIEIGHASDTTLARSSAGNLTVEGNLLYRAGGSFVGMPVEIGIACSDETTAITTGTAKATFRMPFAMTLTAVRASVTTAPTGSTILIDINETGSTILSTKLMIDASEKTSTTAATPYVISDSALADDAEITIDFDQVGSTIAGAGVKVWLIGTRA